MYALKLIVRTSGKSWHISRICFKAGNTHLSFFNSSTNLVIHVIFWASLSYKMDFVCCWLMCVYLHVMGLKYMFPSFDFVQSLLSLKHPHPTLYSPKVHLPVYIHTWQNSSLWINVRKKFQQHVPVNSYSPRS